ncbi:hypothetical protein ACIBQX_10935 [Nonomuraea sp. NPDC049714]|uniref:hypothetical protein n=1 Tax=Nonomuraea sp. NPDC049714 TaxID=3364357 RepID=UPI0037B19FE3
MALFPIARLYGRFFASVSCRTAVLLRWPALLGPLECSEITLVEPVVDFRHLLASGAGKAIVYAKLLQPGAYLSPKPYPCAAYDPFGWRERRRVGVSLTCDELSDILARSSGPLGDLRYPDEIAVEAYEDNFWSMNPGKDIGAASRINGVLPVDDDGEQINTGSSKKHGIELLHKCGHRFIVINVSARHHEGRPPYN